MTDDHLASTNGLVRILTMHVWIRRSATMGLWLVSLLATLAFAPQMIERWRVVERFVAPPPIEIFNQQLQWVDPSEMLTTSTGSVWRRTCKRVTVTRQFILDDGAVIPAEVTVLAGSLRLGTSPLHVMSITPVRRGPAKLSLKVPEWFKEPWRIRYYVTGGIVSDEQPCDDGWSGSWRIYTADVPKWPFGRREQASR